MFRSSDVGLGMSTLDVDTLVQFEGGRAYNTADF